MNKLDLTDNKNRILPKLLTMQAQQAGDTEFLITDERRLTFAEAEQLANSMAAGLRELGVGKGSRVAFYLDNGWEPVLVALAIMMVVLWRHWIGSGWRKAVLAMALLAVVGGGLGGVAAGSVMWGGRRGARAASPRAKSVATVMALSGGVGLLLSSAVLYLTYPPDW